MNTPTPRTDAEHAQFPMGGFTLDFARQLERELTAAQEEITLLKTNLKIQTNHTENAVQDRADEHIELHNQIHELREQRDRLVAALELIEDRYIDGANSYDDMRFMGKTAAEALQSLNTTEL